jgi:hypothetical protein
MIPIITISRAVASIGKEIGQMLAAILGYDCGDRKKNLHDIKGNQR